MLELRFGSYSIAATFAGTPTLSRRKSTWRYCFLWPPPRCHTTISPWLLRPPERFFGSSNDFSGVSLVMWLLSKTVINRRDAVYGLKLFSPIASLPLTFLRRCNFPCGAPSTYCFSHLLDFNFTGPGLPNSLLPTRLQVLRVLDHLFAFGEFHVGLLPILAIAHALSATTHLADKIRRANVADLDFKNLLHRFFDFGLARSGRDFEYDRVLQFLHAETFFRDDRPANDLIGRGCHRLLPLLSGLRGFLGRGLLGPSLGGLWRRFLFRCRRRSDRLDVRSCSFRRFRIERAHEARDRFLGEQQQIVVQQVVRLHRVRSHELDALEIPAGELKVTILAVRNDQRRLRVLQVAERFGEHLGLVRIERPLVDDRQLLVGEFGRKRRAQRAEQHFLGQRIAVIARLRSVNRSAMAPERRPNRADARAAGALLPPKLAASAANFTLIFGLMGAAANLAHVPARSFVQQVRIHLGAKHGVGEVHLPDLFATQI